MLLFSLVGPEEEDGIVGLFAPQLWSPVPVPVTPLGIPVDVGVVSLPAPPPVAVTPAGTVGEMKLPAESQQLAQQVGLERAAEET